MSESGESLKWASPAALDNRYPLYTGSFIVIG